MTLIKKQILLIEDDLIDQMAFTRMFSQKMSGFSYTIANSIHEAQQFLRTEVFDIVISDFNLADGTTFDLLKDLNNTPVIIITGNEDDATISTAKLEIGAAACFTKDLNLDYLNKMPNAVEAILSKKNFQLDLPKPVQFKQEITEDADNALQYNLKKINEIFDGNKKLVKETIQVFIKHKINELEELKQAVFVDDDCNKVKKIVHKMQSGFRVFDMTSQEQIAGQIEKLASTCSKENNEAILAIDALYKKLKEQTYLVIELLKKELLTF